MPSPQLLPRRYIWLALAALSYGGAAHAVKIRVKGSASLEGRAVVEPGGVIVRGRLLDDADQPISGAGTHARLRLRASREGSFQKLPTPEACDKTTTDKIHVATNDATEPDEYRIDPEESGGAFCVRLRDVNPSGAVELAFEGNAYYAGHTALIDFDSSQRSLSLRFFPAPDRLSLDRASHVIGVDTAVEPPISADEQTSMVQLELVFADGNAPPKALAAAAVRPGERAQFELASQKLGRPGSGRLTVRYAGSQSVHSAEHSVLVQKTLRVSLSIAGPVARADPQEGVELKVAVGSALGAVPSGSVEARVAGEPVGTAPVIAGAARLVAVFDAARAGEIPISLHYLPGSPWWLAGDPLHTTVPVKSPSAWRRLPWIIAALIIGSWVVRGWRRPGRTEPKHGKTRALPTGRASVDLIERGPVRAGWRGTVVDAHDGTALAGARVVISIPAFGGDGVACSAITDDAGHFTLEHVSDAGNEGARMQASARWHSNLVRPVPATGEVVINLVSRRRTLVERLVEWANHKGRPWKESAEPTPGHVERTARTRRAHDVADWAGAVEEAAYGALPPDEVEERRIRAQEPEWGRVQPMPLVQKAPDEDAG